MSPPAERLSPPRDVGGRCNTSHCMVSWAPPRTWADMGFADFRYELDLRQTVCVHQGMLGGIAGPGLPVGQTTLPVSVPSPGHGPGLHGELTLPTVTPDPTRIPEVPPLTREAPPTPGHHLKPTQEQFRVPKPGAAHGSPGPDACGRCAERPVEHVEPLGGIWFARHCLLPRIPEIRDKVSDNEHINPKILRKDLQQPKDKEVPPP
ncbi:Granulocyte-macrophage colony-stimulating factor receptor subunit alpha [Lemmus lemmus]